MKLLIETRTYLLALAAILLTCCLGCAQKTPHQTTIPIIPKTPDNYKGDVYYYIPSIKYQMRLTSNGIAYSYPLLPEQIQQKLKDMPDWSENGEIMADDGLITEEEFYRRKLNILAEAFSDLDMAKYLIAHGYEEFRWYDEIYAAEYAQKALDKEPDDYQTLYVWTSIHTALDAEKTEYGFRRLVELNPYPAEELYNLGLHLVVAGENRADYEEAIGFLNRSIALAPNGFVGGAYRAMGQAYAKLGDREKALTFYKRSQKIYYGERTQKVIESLEKEE